MPIRVAIVEDDERSLDRLKMIIESSTDLVCSEVFIDSKSFLNRVKKLKADVVLMDIKLPEVSGIQCVERGSSIRPDIYFLMCTDFEDTDKIYKSLEVGAHGYILKNIVPAKIIQAINGVYNGELSTSPSIAKKVLESFRIKEKDRKLLQSLSHRQKEVLGWLTKGYKSKEIGEKLFISVETVNSHIKIIYEKLHVNNRSQATNKLN